MHDAEPSPISRNTHFFASGTLADATSCIVTCHLAMCRYCANHVLRLGMLSGQMLVSWKSRPSPEHPLGRKLPIEPLKDWYRNRTKIEKTLLRLPLARRW